MKLKVCGMNNPSNILEIAQLGPSYLGFIFYKNSKRFVTDPSIMGLLSNWPYGDKILKIGVFVNSELEEVLKIVDDYKLDFIQLHGDEEIEYQKELKRHGMKIIKAISVTDDFDWNSLQLYAAYSDYFLFDTPTKNYGGSGIKFNWDALNNYKLDTPFFLSGGIETSDIKKIKALNISNLFAIDVNSKMEIQPGIKNPEFIKQTINLLSNEN